MECLQEARNTRVECDGYRGTYKLPDLVFLIGEWSYFSNELSWRIIWENVNVVCEVMHLHMIHKKTTKLCSVRFC